MGQFTHTSQSLNLLRTNKHALISSSYLSPPPPTAIHHLPLQTPAPPHL